MATQRSDMHTQSRMPLNGTDGTGVGTGVGAGECVTQSRVSSSVGAGPDFEAIPRDEAAPPPGYRASSSDPHSDRTSAALRI